MLLQMRNTVYAGQRGDTCYYRGGILYMLDSRGIHAITEMEYCTIMYMCRTKYMMDNRGIHAITEAEYFKCWTEGSIMLNRGWTEGNTCCNR
jgi:hypothetical protein